MNKRYWLKERKTFYLVFIEMQMYGPRQGSRTLPWAKCQIFLEALFICNNINTNLNKNFYTWLSYHSFKPLFLFFLIFASSFKNSKNRPKQATFPYSNLNKTFTIFFYLAQQISLRLNLRKRTKVSKLHLRWM